MTRQRRSGIGMWFFLGASAVSAAVALAVGGKSFVMYLADRSSIQNDSTVEPSVTSADAPILAEASVFRTVISDLAIGTASESHRPAHPRTLARYRAVRAYPGAPPRIPHGLTPREYREGRCDACHERGGFSLRFNAYVPVTPHPAMGACLQCHVGDNTLMAIPLPSTDPNSRCLQCHIAGGGMRARDTSTSWKTMAWPVVGRFLPGSPPPPIPHDLRMRGNCLACHAGPSGVIEIQTPHPERSNCRQCHVAAGDPGDRGATFVRTTDAQGGVTP